MDERVFFEDRGVKVTNARFLVHAQTYAMNGVTSVKSDVTPPDRTGLIVMAAVGLLILVAADGIGKLLGLAVAGFALWLLSRQKSTHAVYLSSASGEVQALTDEDEGFIGDVVRALNDALIHRG